jgi:hypothetical protein
VTGLYPAASSATTDDYGFRKGKKGNNRVGTLVGAIPYEEHRALYSFI